MTTAEQKIRGQNEGHTLESDLCMSTNYTFSVFLDYNFSISDAVIKRTLQIFLSGSNLPVELGVFDERVSVSISDEHITADTSEAFRVVLLRSSNLLIQGGSLVKHNAEAKGHHMTFGGVRLEGPNAALNYAFFLYIPASRPCSVRMFSEDILWFEWGKKSIYFHTRREPRGRKALNV